MITRKPMDFPPQVARAFAKDMALYFLETNPIKRDELALRQLYVLRELQGPRDKALRLSDVKRMFVLMRNTG